VEDQRPAMMQGMARPMDLMRDMMQPGAIGGKGNNVLMHDQSLLGLIAAAYRVKTTEVSGPTWMTDELFDVDARIPEGISRDHANEMLQALLEDRFGLKMHRETREVSGYSLIVGKNGPKLKAAAPPPADDPSKENISPEERAKAALPSETEMQKRMQAMMAETRASGKVGMSRRNLPAATSEDLAKAIATMAKSPVIDMTGLQGKYEVVLETYQGRGDDPGHTIFDAVAELGLKLVARRVPVDSIVVDRISKTPTEN
jgi:uncharacterized protein (TIGR03435 family)